MSAAVLLAFAAGFPAAAGLVELAAARKARRRQRGRVRRLVLDLGRRLGAPPPPGDLAERLDAAGAPMTVPDAMAVKSGLALVAALATLPLALGVPGRTGLLLPLGAAGGGFVALDAWLLARARRRTEVVTLELPAALDLLRVAVQAGMPTMRAIGEVGHRHGGLLGGELVRTASRVAVGVPRATALEGLRRRAPTPEVRALVAVLHRADRLGTPPADALAALARDAREARARTRTEAAAKASPKIQLVVALLLVPAVMLLVAAALAPALLDAL